MVIIPRQNDVLFGKGTAINTHHGNKRYRSIVELQKSIFLKSKRKEKREIAKNLVREIEKMGGRFLMEGTNSSNIKKYGGDGGTGQPNPDNSGRDLVTDPLILARVWVHVENDKAIEKVMHRLREKRVSAGQKQPAEGGNLELPPDTAVSQVDAINGMAAGTQMNAKPSSRYREEEKVASNLSGHFDTNRVARETNSTMDNFAQVPVPRRIQPTLRPLPPQPPNIHGITSSAPTPVSLKFWIKSTGALSSKEDYVRSATSLACMLTKRLVQIVASMNIPAQELSTEKVIVFVEPHWTPQGIHHQLNVSKLSIKAVQFHFETQGALPLLHSATCALDSGSSLQSRTLSMLLGGMFLEMFTMGRSSLLEISSDTLHNDSGFNHHYGYCGANPPPLKKRALVPTNDSIVAKAKRLLVESEMPMSICRLVCDMLGVMNEPQRDLTITSLDEALWDLTQMMTYPQSFLLDRTCPLQAMVDTCLFTDTHLFGRERETLFGRENELKVLLNAKQKIATHVLMQGKQRKEASKSNTPSNDENGEEGVAFAPETDFLCEAIYLSGYAGSGKTTLLDMLASACNEDGWFVLRLKFEKQTAPALVLAKAFDDFFGAWASNSNGDRADLDPARIQSFQHICDFIKFTIDEEGLNLLFPIIPNLSKVFPEIATAGNDKRTSFIDNVGSATSRRMTLFHVLVKALCSSGRPTVLIHDDLQCANSLEGMKDFIVNYVKVPCGNPCGNQNVACHGLLIVGAFRSNEIKDNPGLLETIDFIDQCGKAKVTKLTIGELRENDIVKLLSAKLCLPIRYTRKLAELVALKSRGNPFFIFEFLKAIIENRMLEFSINDRRWMWDCDVIDMKMISDGVAELLTTRFNTLPVPLIETVRIVSCFGSQVEGSILCLLKDGHVPVNIEDVLRLAISEGLLEKAGPIYQFPHDLIQQTIYDLIPSENRKLIHKSIGKRLLQSGDNSPAVYVLAVDQINISCKDAALSSEERTSFAELNVRAAKFAIASSSFEQARSYVDVGMKFLEPQQRWEKQYQTCLQLHEISTSLSYMHGDVHNMSSTLNEIIANVKSFEDSLTSSSLLAKLLACSSKYKEAIASCLSVLSNLGEDISGNVSLPLVQSELAVVQTTLANITTEQVKMLSPMTDKSKLNAMEFLSMLCMYSRISKPMLLPIISCRMVRLTIEHGFCDSSIVGLAAAGFGLFTFTDDIHLGYRIGKVCDSLIKESPSRHALRSRLCHELDGTLKALIEPQKTIVPLFMDRYNSAMLTGDVESAMACLSAFCTASFYTGTNLESVSKSFISLIEQSAKYRQTNALHIAMTNFRAVIHLNGRNNSEVGIKSYNELGEIGEKTNSNLLQWRVFMSQMSNYFYDRNWVKVMELSEAKPPGRANFNRILASGRALYDGVASLTLARQTHQLKWRRIGEEAVEKMTKYEEVSNANYSWLAKLLQAELHYLNRNLEPAKAAFEASIDSARDNKFTNHEALGHELYGIFCIENEMGAKGAEQLQMALKKYKQWGATKKANDLVSFMDIVDPTALQEISKWR